MNPHAHDPLMRDVLSEGSDFETSSLDLTLQEVRRRRGRRRQRTAILGVIAVAILTFACLVREPNQSERRMAPDVAVTSPSVALVHTTVGSLEIVHTMTGDFSVIDTPVVASSALEIADEQLFSLLGERTGAIVRSKNGRAAFLLVDTDQRPESRPH